MFRSTDLAAIGFGAVTLASLLALPLLSPVSADAPNDYLPKQIENQGQAIEAVPAGSYDDSGLSGGFPEEDPIGLRDAAPETYS